MKGQDSAPSTEFELFVADIERRLTSRAEARRAELTTEITVLRGLLDRAEALDAADLAGEIRTRLHPRIASLAMLGAPLPLALTAPAPVVAAPVAPQPTPPATTSMSAPVVERPVTEKPVAVKAPEKTKLLLEKEPSKPATPPVPAPKLKAPPLSRTQYTAAIRKQNDARREFLATSKMTPAREARLKSLVLEERRLHEAAARLGIDDEFDYRKSMEELSDRFAAQAQEREFFGFSTGRFHPVETWERLAEGFALLSTTEEALELLEKAELPFTDEDRHAILVAAAAPEALVYRTMRELIPPAMSAQVAAIHDRIEALREGHYIPVYNLAVVTLERVEKEAREAPVVIGQIRERIERTERKKSAREALAKIAHDLGEPGAFEETLVPAVRKFLDAGNPPSDKTLVEMVLPYRQAFEDLDDPAFAVLIRNLRTRETLLLKQGIPSETTEDLPETDGTSEIVGKVREYLRGKKLLLVGGNPVPERSEDIAKAFECEVIWPQTRNETNVNDLIKRVPEADLVVRMIRWSRHSYVLVNDEARRLGKPSINLKAGYGVNRLAHDIHAQLLAKSGAEA